MSLYAEGFCFDIIKIVSGVLRSPVVSIIDGSIILDQELNFVETVKTHHDYANHRRSYDESAAIAAVTRTIVADRTG